MTKSNVNKRRIFLQYGASNTDCKNFLLWFRNILQPIQKQDIMKVVGHREKKRDLRPMKDNNKLKIQIKGKQTNKKL